ncbi:helix-turn-helix transcriptional regulator [Vallitalea pronyensis]|uniref:Helix-turn-helix transcriptional regulator n=1 Tax=Vallitalea pronyensis TaxID=1348613 RepID=A0A8J8MN89_9FIRM|nr:helix-turn-helix transcriptional regulator [Vallitalea pronyensis]QUI24905.1 helix-turn-helix transcriptional regulator [Vallitalea pronyensis]
MSLLNRIKELCIEYEISLTQLEKELGFSNGSLSKWDRISPSIYKLEKIADYFSTSIDYLLSRKNEGIHPKTLGLTQKINLLNDEDYQLVKQVVNRLL